MSAALFLLSKHLLGECFWVFPYSYLGNPLYQVNMASCMNVCAFLAVLMSVLAYYALKPVPIEFRFSTDIKASLQDVWNFFKDPTKMAKVYDHV